MRVPSESDPLVEGLFSTRGGQSVTVSAIPVMCSGVIEVLQELHPSGPST